MDNFLKQLLDMIRRDASDINAHMDFARLAAFLTLDVLTKVSFDLEVGYVKANRDHFNYLRSMQNFTPVMDLCCNHPIIFKILKSKVINDFLKPRGRR